jgi:acetyl-CoA acetyltransferase
MASIQAGLSDGLGRHAGQPPVFGSGTASRSCRFAQNIMLGDSDYGIGGGVEVMSRAGYMSTAMRTGARMGDTKVIDMPWFAHLERSLRCRSHGHHRRKPRGQVEHPDA